MGTDKKRLDFIQKQEAILSFASAERGTDRQWRCWVPAMRFSSPDIRERSERIGYGRTARGAIQACMADSGLVVPFFQT